jgi:hypothetical protein
VLVQPLMLFNPGKVAATSRLCWERGVALVVVGFPATPLLTARARICISASHTRKDLDYALEVDPRSPKFPLRAPKSLPPNDRNDLNSHCRL